MGIKSDKTFEEIVERLVALVRPEPKEPDPAVVRPDDPSPDKHPDRTSTRPVPGTPSDNQAR